MKSFLLFFIFCMFLSISYAQNKYADSIAVYMKNYADKHEVVLGADKKNFRFYKPDEKYRVHAEFERIVNGPWFRLPTSAKKMKTYRVYGRLSFKIHDTLVQLYVYQSQSLILDEKYKDYLFLPFTDLTTGVETYESGRYMDFRTTDIVNNSLTIDFNKAYNPYCAYVSDIYNCPIPPQENHLKVSIRAGEKKF